MGINAIPGVIPLHDEARLQIRIEHERRWQCCDLPCFGDRAIAVQKNGKIGSNGLKEVLDALVGIGNVNRQYLYTAVCTRREAIERRQFLATRLAPGGEEMHQHDVAPLASRATAVPAMLGKTNIGFAPAVQRCKSAARAHGGGIAKQKSATAQLSAATVFKRNVPRTSGAGRWTTTPR